MRDRRDVIIGRLRAIAQSQGINDAELCRRINVRPSTWANYVSENDKRTITLDVAIKVCDQFSVTLDWLYRGKTSLIPLEILQAERRLAA